MNISTALVYCFLVILAGVVAVEGLSDQKRSAEQEDIGARGPLTCEGNDALYPHTTDCMRHVMFCSLGITVHPIICERIYRAYSHTLRSRCVKIVFSVYHCEVYALTWGVYQPGVRANQESVLTRSIS